MNETERDPESGGPPEDGGPRPGPQQRWDRDGGRRRRGRRGRGGRGPGSGPGLPGPRAPGEEDEGSSQAREIAAYERRQRQPQRGGQRGGQRYQELVRRATAGPRTGPPEEAGEPIAGPHAVLEALRAGRVLRRIYVSSDRGIRTGAVNDLIREAQEKRVQVRFTDPMEVQRLSPGVEHQGVVAIAEGRAGVDLDELLLHLETVTQPPLVLVIDSLQDPQNYGVLLRSAEGAGAHGVVIPRHRQVGLTPAVARTSAGASEHLLIADVVNLRQAIDALKERGIWVVGTDDTGDLDWDAVDYRGPTAIVIGGEGEGIRRLVLEGCDEVVRVPMQGKVSSLNAAAAGTVVLFEALRQRMRDAAPPVVERRPAAPPAPASDERDRMDDEIIDEQDELPEGEDVVPVRDDADALIEEDTTDLMKDEDAATGEDVRGDDQDAQAFAEAAAEDEHAEIDTDAMDALPPAPAAKAARKTVRKPAAKKPTVAKPAAKRTARKKAE